MSQLRDESMLSGLDAREYFQNAVRTAMHHQRFAASGEAELYLVNLLLSFLRSERLFEETPDGLMIKPLAFHYSDALSAVSEVNRAHSLQRLGDVALFISGLYAHSLGRCLVDIDYYIAMGGNAYSHLADSPRYFPRLKVLKMVFDELSLKFTGFVDILAEISEEAQINGNLDILRLYELWLCTGSERTANSLRRLGIQPVRTQRCSH